MLVLDGSLGEGGGQILRSALALSMVTGVPVRIEHIRGRRPKPGLRHQHLAAVLAAAEVSGGELEGAALGSQSLVFRPGAVRPGRYRFAIDTAGSTTLLLQTLLPALLRAPGPTTLVIEGGTHNPFAPPFEFLERAFCPLIGRMGPRVELALRRHGFHPAGGGCLEASVEPCAALRGLELLERGRVRRRRAEAIVAALPRHIAERELEVVGRKAGWQRRELRVEEVAEAAGPGNVLLLTVECEAVTEVFSAFGQIRLPAEAVAERAVRSWQRWERARVPVGANLADQILLPMALAGGGAFLTLEPTEHTRTHIELIRKFLDVQVTAQEQAADRWLIRVG